MGVGLLGLLRNESFDPLFDLGNVFGFFEALRMGIPGLGKLPVE
jgi:hypothetical protein